MYSGLSHEALMAKSARERSFMAGTSNAKKIAFLLTNGVEQVELTEPRKALDAAGAKTVIVSPAKGDCR
jgi:hypothetical protein